MKIIPTNLAGVLIVEPDAFVDPRGFFMETYQRRRYGQMGIGSQFVQDNLSFSVKGTLRGMHYQKTHPQAKLVQVITGEIFDVAVDIRPGSPDFGRWTGVVLSDKNRRQVLIPEGFAHGFCVCSETAHVWYKCSDYYRPDDEGGIHWSDPDIRIDWPVKEPVLSDKDRRFSFLRDLSPGQLPVTEA
ncbi:MAG: dTDP-4-dehydrorhamnose 3,5-epimerase [Thermodesulfobacteriota bacterium]